MCEGIISTESLPAPRTHRTHFCANQRTPESHANNASTDLRPNRVSSGKHTSVTRVLYTRGSTPPKPVPPKCTGLRGAPRMSTKRRFPLPSKQDQMNPAHTLAKTSRAGQDMPIHLKGSWVPKLTDTMSFSTPHTPKQRLFFAVPFYPRFPSPVQVQVRSSWHISRSTPWIYQGCGSPPQPDK